jgi:hypothetical protein
LGLLLLLLWWQPRQHQQQVAGQQPNWSLQQLGWVPRLLIVSLQVASQRGLLLCQHCCLLLLCALQQHQRLALQLVSPLLLLLLLAVGPCQRAWVCGPGHQ